MFLCYSNVGCLHFSAERAEREKVAKEKAEKQRQEKEKERQQMHDRQEQARILRESAQLAQDAVNQHFTESLRRVGNEHAMCCEYISAIS